MPAFLARVPLTLPLDAPLPGQCAPRCRCSRRSSSAPSARGHGRLAGRRGRTYRDALRRLLEQEHFDRIIVSADGNGNGLETDDLEWLLKRVPAEVLILRPASDDTRRLSAASGLNGHF